MIKFEHTEVVGWQAAIRGMRNPMNSWEKSDSYDSVNCEKCGIIERDGICKPAEHRAECEKYREWYIGPNDLNLMKNLCKAGTDHRKFMRMLIVYVDITAPLYWWKEFDTYKVGTVANSCSTMHKIHAEKFTTDNFSIEHLDEDVIESPFKTIIDCLNFFRALFIQHKDKEDWWHMIQLLPSSYNQKRTIMLNYEVLRNMYHARKNHKLDEWHDFCDWVRTLPYAEKLIIGENNEDTNRAETE